MEVSASEHAASAFCLEYGLDDAYWWSLDCSHLLTKNEIASAHDQIVIGDERQCLDPLADIFDVSPGRPPEPRFGGSSLFKACIPCTDSNMKARPQGLPVSYAGSIRTKSSPMSSVGAL